MVPGNGGGRSAVWLLVAVLALFGTIAVLRSQSPTPEAPGTQDQTRQAPLPGAISLGALPAPLPDESATGGAPSGELSVTDPPPGVLAAPAPPGPAGVPGMAMAAYQHAERALTVSAPRCRLTWPVLAALGRAASGHARGGQVDTHGRTIGRFLGPRLDGSPGLPRVPDTDQGRLDTDPMWDRAVGPMQIVPATWQRYAADGDGDGQADPNDLSDAALTAGRYLCAGNTDLSVPEQRRTALYRVNRSDSYVTAVAAFATEYAAPPPAIAAPTAPPAPPVALVAPPTRTQGPPRPTHRAAQTHRSSVTPGTPKRTPSAARTPASSAPASATSKPPVRPNRILPPTSNAPGAPPENTPVTRPASSTPAPTPVTTTVTVTPQPKPSQPPPSGSIPIIVLPPATTTPRSTH